MATYAPDPANISLDQLLGLITSKRLTPGRKVLLEDICHRFGILAGCRIENLKQLISKLNSKKKIREFAETNRIPEQYLQVLVREAKSYLPRPFPLSDFPGIPHEYAESLRSAGLTSTRDLFEAVQAPGGQRKLAGRTGIPAGRIRELACLCDLSRITGMGPLFARITYMAGVRTLGEFAAAEPRLLRKRQEEAIRTARVQAGIPSLEDVRFCQVYAEVLMKASGA